MDLELAWCAGFFDGEGCSYGHKGTAKSRPDLLLVVAQSSNKDVPQTLARFQRRLGGRIYPLRSQSQWSKKPRWQWQAKNLAARQAMAQLIPLLSDDKLEQYSRAVERVALAKELRREG